MKEKQTGFGEQSVTSYYELCHWNITNQNNIGLRRYFVSERNNRNSQFVITVCFCSPSLECYSKLLKSCLPDTHTFLYPTWCVNNIEIHNIQMSMEECIGPTADFPQTNQTTLSTCAYATVFRPLALTVKLPWGTYEETWTRYSHGWKRCEWKKKLYKSHSLLM